MRNEERFDALFEELVPISGPAPTVAGEIVRAACRIGHRWNNDGDMLGRGYGKETCNPAARYLIIKCDPRTERLLLELMYETWRLDDDAYEARLDEVLDAVLAFLDAHPELKETENQDDMLRYRDPVEDRDEYEEEW